MRAITNAQVITPNGILEQHTVIYDKQIVQVIPDRNFVSYNVEEVVNAQGKFLSPGFIDLHIHGCAGADTMDGTAEALQLIRTKLAETGVTAFLPTTMTMPFEKIEHVLGLIREAQTLSGMVQILGCHVEGPFINQDYKGAQDSKHIIDPDFNKIEKYHDVIRLITIAPELAGSDVFIGECQKYNIIVSIGHSAATYEEGMAAVKAGASHVTHTFNALAAFNHRQPGILGVLADCQHVTCELIADNIHVHPAVQRMLLKVKDSNSLILITDAMRACLVGEGEFDLGGQKVIVANGQARLASGVIAGSILTLNRAVANFRATSRLPLEEVVKMVTINPARRLGLDQCKGSICAGKDADMVIFDDRLDVSATYVMGHQVFSK